MFKAMLVDDEMWILESLKATVDWRGLGYEIIATAANGIEGYERLVELKPDIAFVDIRMPGMNGIALIEKLKQAGVPTKIIIASGYAEFEYAKQAIRFGAVGYCLKPFREEEITELLETVKVSLLKERQALLGELTVLLQDDHNVQAERLSDVLGRLGLRGEEGLFFAVAQHTGAVSLFNGETAAAVQVGRGVTAYLLPGRRYPEIVRRLAASLPEQVKGVGISELFTDLTQICLYMDAACRASYAYFVSGHPFREGGVRASESKLDAEAMKSIVDGVQREDVHRIESGFRQLQAQFLAGQYEMNQAGQLYHIMMAHLYPSIEAAGVPEWIENDGLTGIYRDVPDMIAALLQLAIEVVNQPKTAEDDAGSADGDRAATSQLIVQYIDEHFREPLSIKEIAKQFYMHPNYLSSLFKKELHINFTKYVTDLRIRHACELLRATSLEVNEVAEKSGYQDYFYFAKLFKRHMGRTPSEYRSEKDQR